MVDHANSTSDRNIMDILTDAAVRAFRKLEFAKLHADVAEYELEQALRVGNINMEEYYRLTERDIQEFEDRRANLEHRGKLPRSRHAPKTRRNPSGQG